MYPRLVGDVGGSHTRLAWQAAPGRALERLARLRNEAHAGLAEAIEAYLTEQQLAPPLAACLGLATAVTADRVALTNLGWSFSVEELGRRLRIRHLRVINDFTALALALPGLDPAEKRQVGGGPGRDRQPLALLGPGTGLGMGGLLPVAGGGWQALAGEGGHATLAAHTELEWRLIERLRAQDQGHVSAERVLSGPGLVRLHSALRHETQGPVAEPSWSAERIVRQALQEGDACCLQALELFAGFLGSVAGNLALTLGARGGVYLGGGMLPHLGEWFGRSGFRARFEAKGRFQAYLREIPVWVIDDRQAPALRGAALALDLEPLT